MGERVWQKFHPIFGPDLKVGFETTFPKGTALNDLDPLYEKSELIHKPSNETTVRVYEPARVFCSCFDGRQAQVLFVPVPQKGALFRRLVFARKIEKGQPRRWMVVARHEEAVPFGFDSWNSKNQRYLALAYPGDEEFTLTYVKAQVFEEEKEEGFIRDVSGEFVYLELWVDDDEVQVLFSARRVNEDAVPKHLLQAMPGERRRKVTRATIATTI